MPLEESSLTVTKCPCTVTEITNPPKHYIADQGSKGKIVATDKFSRYWYYFIGLVLTSQTELATLSPLVDFSHTNWS